MQTNIRSQPDRKLNVAVIGNSNSIMMTSYARVLAAYPDVSVRNFSVGGVPNVVLLNFLTDPTVDFQTLDVVIVEPAIIEGLHLKLGSHYTTEQSAAVIDLFMSALRAKSTARVVFLILPIAFALLEPKYYFVESHYLNCARRHRADVLNGYEIFRQISGLDPKGMQPDFLSKARRFISAFQLQDDALFTIRLLGWQSSAALHRADIGTKAFCQVAFVDPIHISRVFHGLIAELLYRWMAKSEARNETADQFRHMHDFVLRSQGTPTNSADYVTHNNTLISRTLLQLKSGQTAIFPCDANFRAVSVLVNEYQTSGFLNLQSPLGDASVDARFTTHRVGWNATIARIPGTVGGGPICMSISDQPLPTAALDNHRFLATADGPSLGVAEVGELVLAESSACMGTTNATDEVNPHPLSIEQAEWALSIIHYTGTISARAIAGTMESYGVVQKKTLPGAASVAPADEEQIAIRARALAASLAFQHAKDVLLDGLSKMPESSLLSEMKAALDDLGVWLA